MPLEIACSECESKFRVPDSAAGKKIRCPKCKGAIDVPVEDSPASAEDGSWYLKDEEGNNYGPVPRLELDIWYDDGRITADCQLLRAGSQQWQWASDVYPDLEDEESAVRPAAPAFSLAKQSAASEAAQLQAPRIEVTPTVKSTNPAPSPPRTPAAEPRGDPGRSSRSKAIAGLLGIFLGPLGIHRFYLGYWGMGLAMLVTAGGCGVWSLVDAVFVILGRVNDADGRPLSD